MISFSSSNLMKKYLTLLGVAVVSAISLIASPVNAQEAVAASTQETVTDYRGLTPRKLISLGRHGRFKAQGIPGYSRFGSAIRSGKVDAQKLVASAVAQNRLPEEALQDVEFINSVSSHLNAGGCGTN